MADVNKSISINFEGKTDDLQAELKRIPVVTRVAAGQMAKQIDSALEKSARKAREVSAKIGKSFKAAGKAAAGVGLAAAGAGVAVVAFAQHMADLNNQLTDASTRSGLAIDTLAGLRLAAEGSGLAFENLERGLDRFPAAIKAARDGSKSVMAAFDSLGVTLDDLEGKNTDQLFRQVARALGSIEDPAERTSAAMRLFGAATAGALVQSGALQNMQAFADLASEFGVDMENAADSAGLFQRAMAELKLVVQGVGSDMLQAATDSEGLEESIFSLSDAVVFFGSITTDTIQSAVSAFEFVSRAVEIRTTQISMFFQNMEHAISFEFDKINENTQRTFAEIAQLEQAAMQAEKGIVGFSTAYENANSRVAELQKLRAAALEQGAAEARLAGILDSQLKNQAASAKEAAEAQKRLAEEQAKRNALAEQIAAGDAAAQAELAAITQQVTDASMTAHQLEIQAIDERIAKVSELAMVTGDHAQAYDTIQRLQAQRDKAIHDNRIAMLQQEQDLSLQMASIVASSVGSTAASIQTLLENTGEITKRQAMNLFYLQKAAGVAEIAINTSVAITKALAQLGPIGGPVAAGFMAAAGAAQTAAVLSQPPPAFDVGGMIGRTSGADVVQASLLTGEAVLDRATVRRIGGEDGLNALQRGDMPQQQVVVVQPFKHFDKFMQASSRRGRYNTGRRRPLGVGSY
jgi:hypothetical protein